MIGQPAEKDTRIRHRGTHTSEASGKLLIYLEEDKAARAVVIRLGGARADADRGTLDLRHGGKRAAWGRRRVRGPRGLAADKTPFLAQCTAGLPDMQRALLREPAPPGEPTLPCNQAGGARRSPGSGIRIRPGFCRWLEPILTVGAYSPNGRRRSAASRPARRYGGCTGPDVPDRQRSRVDDVHAGTRGRGGRPPRWPLGRGDPLGGRGSPREGARAAW